jgi:lipoprotein-releasing system ATP-binding protein
MIRAEQISRNYGNLQVLKNVSLEIADGEFVSIVGASGAGKTTLLQILGTLDAPDQGKVFYNDVSVFNLKSRTLAKFRSRHIGFVFQFHQLLPEFTAHENVALAARIAGMNKWDAMKDAAKLMERVGVQHRMKHKPSELSGGEQQRVAICRALINKPDVVLADEPTGNLDSANAEAVHVLFRELQAEMNQTIVVVTHNQALAALTDRSLVMKDGELVV